MGFGQRNYYYSTAAQFHEQIDRKRNQKTDILFIELMIESLKSAATVMPWHKWGCKSDERKKLVSLVVPQARCSFGCCCSLSLISKWKFSWPKWCDQIIIKYYFSYCELCYLISIYKAYNNDFHNIRLCIEFDFAAGFGFIYLYLSSSHFICVRPCVMQSQRYGDIVLKNSRWLTNQNYIQNMVTCNEGKRVQMTSTTTTTDVYILMSRVRIRVDC